MLHAKNVKYEMKVYDDPLPLYAVHRNKKKSRKVHRRVLIQRVVQMYLGTLVYVIFQY